MLLRYAKPMFYFKKSLAAPHFASCNSPPKQVHLWSGSLSKVHEEHKNKCYFDVIIVIESDDAISIVGNIL